MHAGVQLPKTVAVGAGCFKLDQRQRCMAAPCQVQTKKKRVIRLASFSPNTLLVNPVHFVAVEIRFEVSFRDISTWIPHSTTSKCLI